MKKDERFESSFLFSTNGMSFVAYLYAKNLELFTDFREQKPDVRCLSVCMARDGVPKPCHF